MLGQGNMNRSVAAHNLNRDSSRSHAIISVVVEQLDREGERTVAKLNMVDLAGSERLSKSGSSGQVQTEAQHINKSLSFLEQVVVALGDPTRGHIPYRSCKLTHILRDSLGGNCKTLMITNLRGELEQFDETLRSCRFAQRMMLIQNSLARNRTADGAREVQRLEREVVDLKEELAMYDALAGKTGVQYEPYAPELRRQVREEALQFLRSDPHAPGFAPLQFKSLRHVKEVLL